MSDGRRVGPIGQEHPPEEVHGLSLGVLFGDHQELVDVTAAGRADVEASTGGGGGDESDRLVGGDALVAVLGRGVGELYELGHIGRRQRDGRVARRRAGGDRSVVVGGGDGPSVHGCGRGRLRWW